MGNEQSIQSVRGDEASVPLPPMALIVETRCGTRLICSAAVDGKEVGSGQLGLPADVRRFSQAAPKFGARAAPPPGMMTPFWVTPRCAGALLSLRFRFDVPTTGTWMDTSAVETEVVLPFARLVRLGAPLFASAVLGVRAPEESGDVKGKASSFEDALKGARDPSMPKVVVTVFKPALPWGPGAGPPRPDVRGALMAVEEEGRTEACFGSPPNANASGPAVARQILGVLEALQIAHETALTLSEGATTSVAANASSGGDTTSTEGTTASEGQQSDAEFEAAPPRSAANLRQRKAIEKAKDAFFDDKEEEKLCTPRKLGATLSEGGMRNNVGMPEVFRMPEEQDESTSEELSTMRMELEALRVKDKLQEDAQIEVVRLRTELEVLRVQERQHQYLQHEFSQMQMDLEALRVKERRHKDAEERYQAVQAELSDVRITERRLQGELTQTQAELQSCRAEERLHRELQDEVLRVNAELGALKEKTRDYDGLKAEIVDLQAQLQVAPAGSAAPPDALREELARTQGELKALKEKEVSQQKQPEEINLLYAKIDNLQAELSSARAVAGQQESLDSELARAHMEQEALQRELASARQEAKASRAAAEEKEDEMARLRYKITVLEEALDAAVGESTRGKELESKLSQKELAEKELHSELMRAQNLLKKELETSCRKEVENDRVQSELRRAQEDWNAQGTKLKQELAEKSAQLAETSRDLERLRDERDERDEREILGQTGRDHSAEDDALLRTRRELTTYIEQNGQQAQELLRSRSELSEAMAKWEELDCAKEEELLVARSELSEAMAKCQELDTKKKELSEAMAKCQVLDTTKKELLEVQNQLAGAQLELGQFQDLYADREALLEKKEWQRREVTMAALAMKTELEEARVEEHKLQNAQEDIVRMRNELTWGLDALQTREIQHQNLQSEVERARTEISELHLSEKHEVENARSEIDAMRQKELEHQQKQAEVLRKCSELSALRLKHMHEDRASSEVHVRSKSSTLLRELDSLLMNPGANGKGQSHERMRVRSMSMSNANNKEALLNLPGVGKERTASRPPSWSPRTSTAPTSPPHCSPRTPRTSPRLPAQTTPRGRRSERDGATDLGQFPPATMLGTMKVVDAASVAESAGDLKHFAQGPQLTPVPSSGSGSTAGERTTMMSLSPTGSPRGGSVTTSTRASIRLSEEPAGAKDKPTKLWKSERDSECTQS